MGLWIFLLKWPSCHRHSDMPPEGKQAIGPILSEPPESDVFRVLGDGLVDLVAISSWWPDSFFVVRWA